MEGGWADEGDASTRLSIGKLLALRPPVRLDAGVMTGLSMADVPAEDLLKPQPRKREPRGRGGTIGPITECVSVEAEVLLAKRLELRHIEHVTGAAIKEKAGLRGYTVMITGTTAIVEQALPMVERALGLEVPEQQMQQVEASTTGPALPPWLQANRTDAIGSSAADRRRPPQVPQPAVEEAADWRQSPQVYFESLLQKTSTEATGSSAADWRRPPQVPQPAVEEAADWRRPPQVQQPAVEEAIGSSAADWRRPPQVPQPAVEEAADWRRPPQVQQPAVEEAIGSSAADWRRPPQVPQPAVEEAADWRRPPQVQQLAVEEEDWEIPDHWRPVSGQKPPDSVVNITPAVEPACPAPPPVDIDDGGFWDEEILPGACQAGGPVSHLFQHQHF
ncbi:unnamed protein product [Polarella glacialis]|uniref:Uncharacterized protein n=1 Tax=Polarella glacialis TaxID=89957 RepID=A0A813JU36_POLGL|nr:unnamed protein product [Polarella glacialis]CAE8684650.1 unnamed protein product [Polarella glacialis]